MQDRPYRQISMPNIEIPDLFSTKVAESKFCVDPKQYSQSNSEQKKLLETYKLLNISGAIDHSGCIVESAKSGAQGDLIKNFIKENLENMPVKILMGVEENTNSIRLNMAIQSEKKFNSTVLSTKDRWQIAIGGLTTGTTYLLLETAGLGDKLGMTAKEKKRAIVLSGPIMGTIAGILKEIYDDRNRKKHTVDTHDAVATSLGSGIVIPIVVNFAF